MNIDSNQICCICFQSSFHLHPEYYRLCRCECSPYICTYCCFQKKKCYCTDCGYCFTEQILQLKGNELKRLEIQSKNMDGLSQSRNFEASQFPFQMTFPNNLYQNNQQCYTNQMPPMSYQPTFFSNNYIQQSQQSQSRRMEIPSLATQLGSSLANSLFLSPIQKVDQSMSDGGVFEAYSHSQTSDQNKYQYQDFYQNSQQTNFSNQKNITNSTLNLFGSVSSSFDMKLQNQEYFEQSNTIPWNQNQQNNGMNQIQPNQINQFQKINNQSTSIFNQQNGGNQQNAFNFSQNMSQYQQRIQENINSSIHQSQYQMHQNIFSQETNSSKQHQYQSQNEYQNSQFQSLSQQPTILDQNTQNNFQKFQIFDQNNSNNGLIVKDEQVNRNHHMRYMQNIPQPQKIKTHLYQSLDPSCFLQSRGRSPISTHKETNNFKGSDYGKSVEYFAPKQINQQNAQVQKRINMSKSLSLNDLADKTLKSSLNLDDILKKDSTNSKDKVRPYISNKDLASKFKVFINQSRNSRQSSVNCSQNNQEDTNGFQQFSQNNLGQSQVSQQQNNQFNNVYRNSIGQQSQNNNAFQSYEQNSQPMSQYRNQAILGEINGFNQTPNHFQNQNLRQSQQLFNSQIPQQLSKQDSQSIFNQSQNQFQLSQQNQYQPFQQSQNDNFFINNSVSQQNQQNYYSQQNSQQCQLNYNDQQYTYNSSSNNKMEEM